MTAGKPNRRSSTLRMAILDYESFKVRTVGIADGSVAHDPQAPVLWFPSTEAFATVLSANTLALLVSFTREANPLNAANRDRLCRYNLLRHRQGRSGWKSLTLDLQPSAD